MRAYPMKLYEKWRNGNQYGPRAKVDQRKL